MRRLLAVVAAIVLPASAAQAQTPSPVTRTASLDRAPAYRYRILGVYDEDTGAPLEGVEVADAVSGAKSLTSATGTLSLFFLPDGGGMVRIKKLGYASQAMTIVISPNDTTPLTVLLSRAATTLPTVNVKDRPHVSAHMNTFENHRSQGFGQFITADELRKNDDRPLATVLASKLAGVKLTPGRANSVYLTSTRKTCMGLVLMHNCSLGTPDCYPTVYTDGVKTFDYGLMLRMQPADRQFFIPDFSKINTSDYGAVEFYPGGELVPEGISSTNADCGVLMLWTRDR